MHNVLTDAEICTCLGFFYQEKKMEMCSVVVMITSSF